MKLLPHNYFIAHHHMMRCEDNKIGFFLTGLLNYTIIGLKLLSLTLQSSLKFQSSFISGTDFQKQPV